MNVASPELSKKLYELSRWDDTPTTAYTLCEGFYMVEGKEVFYCNTEDYEYQRIHKRAYDVWPAYDAGYLLRKLPACSSMYVDTEGEYFIANCNLSEEQQFVDEADTPEDALAMLAIKLHEEGVL